MREAGANAYGRFLSLEPLTLAPFDRDTIDPSLLSDRELAQLNAYHARVYETLAPHLDAGDPRVAAWRDRAPREVSLQSAPCLL